MTAYPFPTMLGLSEEKIKNPMSCLVYSETSLIVPSKLFTRIYTEPQGIAQASLPQSISCRNFTWLSSI